MSLLDKLKDLLNTEKDENFEAETPTETPTETPVEETPTEVEFVEVKTTEDIILRVDGELQEGKSIEIIDETGARPADNEEYVLEDGTIIAVEENTIASLTSPEPENDVVVENEPSEEMEDKEDKDKDKEDKDEDYKEENFSKEDISESFNLLINEVKELKSSISEIESLKEELKGMNEDFEKFKKSPSTESLKKEKSNAEWGSLYSKFGKYRK